jgi:hypothetical protein
MLLGQKYLELDKKLNLLNCTPHKHLLSKNIENFYGSSQDTDTQDEQKKQPQAASSYRRAVYEVR